MNGIRATVSKVLPWSAVDGPGNRLVLFLQGCNYSCPGCHNPHTIGTCNDCGDCIPACPQDALSLVDGRIAFDKNACDQCDACLDACPISANPMLEDMSVGDTIQLIRENSAFLTGITVSGGEATLHLEFLIALFTAIKADETLSHLTCFVDSNGHLDAAGWARLLPVCDGVMLDIKAFAPRRHLALTGRGNAKSLASVQIVHAAGKLYELRYLLVPGQNDQEDEITALIALADSLGSDLRLKLNAWQPHGVRGAASDWPKMPRDRVEAIATRLHDAGLSGVVTPVVYL